MVGIGAVVGARDAEVVEELRNGEQRWSTCDSRVACSKSHIEHEQEDYPKGKATGG